MHPYILQSGATRTIVAVASQNDILNNCGQPRRQRHPTLAPMSLLWLRVAVLLYGIAALAVLPAALYDRPRWRHIAIPATIAAVLFHFVSLAEMLNAAHHRPPVDTHETQSLLGLLLAAAFLVVYWRYHTVSLGIFVLPIASCSASSPPSAPGRKPLLPQIHTGWIFLHVALLLAAYAALFVSLLAIVLYLIQERRLKSQSPPASLQAARPLEDHRPDRAQDAALRPALHDRRPAHRLALAQITDRRLLLPRPQDPSRLRHVARLRRR